MRSIIGVMRALLLLAFAGGGACAASVTGGEREVVMAAKSGTSPSSIKQRRRSSSSPFLPSTRGSLSRQDEPWATTGPLSNRQHSSRSAGTKGVTSIGAGGGLAISDTLKKEMMGAGFFLAFDIVLRKVFVKAGIKFPSQLAGCVILAMAMVLVSQLVCEHFADAIFDALSPGAGWLTKWLPVFFVPGLAMFPLAPSIGSPIEVVKMLSVVVVGFLFSLATTVYAVQGVASLLGISLTPQASPKPVAAVPKGGAADPPKPFTADTLKALLTGAAITGAVSVGTTKSDHELMSPLRTLFMIFTTVGAYVFGARLPSSFTKVVHPILTSTGLTWLVSVLFGRLTGQTFEEVLKTYKTGSMAFGKAGAGDVLLFMLGPAVVSFCVAMYSRRKLIAENLPIIGTSMITASAGGLFGTALYVRLINMASGIVRLSVLPRNVTTPLAIAITTILGGDLSIAASVVVLTGILGATAGRATLDFMGIKEPITRGLGIGGAAQGLGVASIAPEKEAFPFAAVSMVLTAVAATCLVSVPSIKQLLIDFTLG